MPAIHLCIDLQKIYVMEGKFTPDEFDTLKGKVAEGITTCAARNIPTVYFAYQPNAAPFFGTVAELRTQRPRFFDTAYGIDLPLADKDLVGIKNKNSVWSIPAFRDFVEQNSYFSPILSGCMEDVEDFDAGYCINNSAEDLRRDGQQVIVAADATNAALPSYWAKHGGLERTTCHGFAIDAYAPPPLELRQTTFGYFGAEVLPTHDIATQLDMIAARDAQNSAPLSSPLAGLHHG